MDFFCYLIVAFSIIVSIEDKDDPSVLGQSSLTESVSSEDEIFEDEFGADFQIFELQVEQVLQRQRGQGVIEQILPSFIHKN